MISFVARNESESDWVLVLNADDESNPGRSDHYSINLGSFPAFSTNQVKFEAPFHGIEYKFHIRILKRANYRERIAHCLQVLRAGAKIGDAVFFLNPKHSLNVTILETATPSFKLSD